MTTLNNTEFDKSLEFFYFQTLGSGRNFNNEPDSQLNQLLLIILYRHLSEATTLSPELGLKIPHFFDFNTSLKSKNRPAAILNAFEQIEKSLEGYAKNVLGGIFLRFEGRDAIKKNNIQQLEGIEKIIDYVATIPWTKEESLISDSVLETLFEKHLRQNLLSKGEFSTPRSIANLTARIATDNFQKKSSPPLFYDMACGTGTLLLNAASCIKDPVYYGLDINSKICDLIKIRLILKGTPLNKIHVFNENAFLIDQLNFEDFFDVIVSDIPPSLKWNPSQLGQSFNINAIKLLPPSSNADYLFFQHAIHCLSPSGQAALVCMPGILTKIGVDLEIRKNLINQQFIEAVISLPGGIRYNTGQSACIVLISKKPKNHIKMIDASSFFEKKGGLAVIESENVEKLLNIIKEGIDNNFCKNVSFDTLEKNSYILDPVRYLAAKDIKSLLDIKSINNDINAIDAHLLNTKVMLDDLFSKINTEFRQ